MKKSYGRLNRWVLRTSPEFATQLKGVDCDRSCSTTYSQIVEFQSYSNCKPTKEKIGLIAPLGIEVYKEKGLGRIEDYDVFFLTSSEDNNDAFIALVNLKFIASKNDEKDRFRLLTDLGYLDSRESSKLLEFLIRRNSGKRSSPIQTPGYCLNHQGLTHCLGFKNISENNNFIRYERL